MNDDEAIIGGPAPTAPGTPEPVSDAGNARILARLREALVASEPGLDPALVQGETLEEVEATFAAARETLQRLREQVRAEAAAAIPAGAPVRGSGFAGSPRDKIRRGLADLGRTA